MLERKDRGRGNGLHVLVVDDDVHTLERVRTTLSEAGYIVTSTDIAENLAARIALLAVDLVLLDVLMPGLSGRDLSALLKSHGNGDSPGIVLLSPIPPAVLTNLVDTDGALGIIHVDRKARVSDVLKGIGEMLANRPEQSTSRPAPQLAKRSEPATTRPVPNVSGTHRIGAAEIARDPSELSRTGGGRRRR